MSDIFDNCLSLLFIFNLEKFERRSFRSNSSYFGFIKDDDNIINSDDEFKNNNNNFITKMRNEIIRNKFKINIIK